MSKFKVGDEVRITLKSNEAYGKIGVISSIGKYEGIGGDYQIDFDFSHCGRYYESEFEPVKPKNCSAERVC